MHDDVSMSEQVSHETPPMLKWAAQIARFIGFAAAALISGLLTTFAIPVEPWRTGDQHLTELTYRPLPRPTNVPRRLWIDTDAACGYSPRTDPDDCFAIALLASARDFQIVGISTVFGNAPLAVVDRTTIELARKLSTEIRRTISVHSGNPGPLTQVTSAPRSPVHEALAAALEHGPLTIVALGPLTNLAAVLNERPALQSHVVRVVAVMGRRQGHMFHPAEGAGTGILFGHGPIFRDFNFVMDIDAAAQIVSMHLPLTLIPYDAARTIEITGADLHRLSKANPALAWIAERARPWLEYWREDIGRRGFYPFDLLAAASTIEPRLFECASAHTWVGQDRTLFVPFWQPIALLADRDGVPSEGTGSSGSALYCGMVSGGLKDWLMGRFVSWQSGWVAAQRKVASTVPESCESRT